MAPGLELFTWQYGAGYLLVYKNTSEKTFVIDLTFTLTGAYVDEHEEEDGKWPVNVECHSGTTFPVHVMFTGDGGMSMKIA